MIWALLFLVGVTIPEAESDLQAGRYAEARQKFEELYALDPTNLRILEGLARSYEGLGQYEDALLYYTQIYQMEPQNPRYRQRTFQLAMLLARRYREMGDWGQARSYLELAVEVNPRDGRAWLWYAQALERLGQKQAALRAYRRAADLGVPEAREALGRLAPSDTSPPEGQTQPETVQKESAAAPVETVQTAADSLTRLVTALKESLAGLILRKSYDSAMVLADSILKLSPNDLGVANLRLQLEDKLRPEKGKPAPLSEQGPGPSVPWTERLLDRLAAWGAPLAAFMAPYPDWMVWGGGGLLLLIMLLFWVSIRASHRRRRVTRTVRPGSAPAPGTRTATSVPSPSPAPSEQPASRSPAPSSPEPPSQPAPSAPVQEPSSPETSLPPPSPAIPEVPVREEPVDEVWATNLEEALSMARAMDEEEEEIPPVQKPRGNPRKMISALVLIAMGRKQGGFQKDLTHGVFFGPGGYIIHAQWGNDLQGEEALRYIIENVNPEDLQFVPGAIPPVKFTMKMSPKALREFLKRYQQEG